MDRCNTTPQPKFGSILSHLPQGAEYRFRVLACNAGGPGSLLRYQEQSKSQKCLWEMGSLTFCYICLETYFLYLCPKMLIVTLPFSPEYPDCELDERYQEGILVDKGGVIRLTIPIKENHSQYVNGPRKAKTLVKRAMIATSGNSH